VRSRLGINFYIFRNPTLLIQEDHLSLFIIPVLPLQFTSMSHQNENAPSALQGAQPESQNATSPDVDTYRLGTRNSQLALVQTHHVAALLNGLHPGDHLQFPVTPMSVLGDRNKTSPLYLLSGDNQAAAAANGEPTAGAKVGAVPAKSLWTEELEVALMKGELDMIIHCLKDMPTRIPDDCEVAAILPREDPHDALVVKKGLHYKTLAELPEGSVVGTSSVRRIAQLRRAYPKLKVMDVVS
jgi:hydroxymethylbilane synthase